MKRVTLTWSMKFPDETPNDDAITSAIEMMNQDDWPNDEQIKIEENLPDDPDVL